MTPRKAGRAFADWVRRHRGERTTADVTSQRATVDTTARPASRTARLRQLATARVTPYQLRRDLLW